MPTPAKLPVKVESVIRHTDSVKTFILQPLKPCPRFKPGQFLHFALETYDPGGFWPESRVFSIANSPTRRGSLRITFAVKGKFTRRMYEEVKAGDTRWVKLPYGSFFFPDEAPEVVLVAGGTGITPFLSYLEHALDTGSKSRISLIYGVRSPEYFLFGPFLEECRRGLAGFRSRVFVEDGRPAGEGIEVTKGIISLDEMLKRPAGKAEALYFLSGPLAMIRGLRKIWLEAGIAAEAIRVDEWE